MPLPEPAPATEIADTTAPMDIVVASASPALDVTEPPSADAPAETVTLAVSEPAEALPTETQSADVQPADVQSADLQSADLQPIVASADPVPDPAEPAMTIAAAQDDSSQTATLTDPPARETTATL